MANLSQIVAALARTDLYLSDDDIWYGEQNESKITSVSLRSASEWSHDEMRVVAAALQTESISVLGLALFLGSGWGSTLDVTDIPHPFPCLMEGCTETLLGRGKLFCSPTCEAAHPVNDALTGRGGESDAIEAGTLLGSVAGR